MKLKMHFPGMESHHGFWKEWWKSWKSHSILNFFILFSCLLKTGNILLIIKQKYVTPKKARFSAFLSHGNLDRNMEYGHGIFSHLIFV